MLTAAAVTAAAAGGSGNGAGFDKGAPKSSTPPTPRRYPVVRDLRQHGEYRPGQHLLRLRGTSATTPAPPHYVAAPARWNRAGPRPGRRHAWASVPSGPPLKEGSSRGRTEIVAEHSYAIAQQLRRPGASTAGVLPAARRGRLRRPLRRRYPGADAIETRRLHPRLPPRTVPGLLRLRSRDHRCRPRPREQYQTRVVPPAPTSSKTTTPPATAWSWSNEEWDPDSDPIRTALPDRITVEEGVDQNEIDQRLVNGGSTWTWPAPPGPGDEGRSSPTRSNIDNPTTGSLLRQHQHQGRAAGQLAARPSSAVGREGIQRAYGGELGGEIAPGAARTSPVPTPPGLMTRRQAQRGEGQGEAGRVRPPDGFASTRRPLRCTAAWPR